MAFELAVSTNGVVYPIWMAPSCRVICSLTAVEDCPVAALCECQVGNSDFGGHRPLLQVSVVLGHAIGARNSAVAMVFEVMRVVLLADFRTAMSSSVSAPVPLKMPTVPVRPAMPEALTV